MNEYDCVVSTEENKSLPYLSSLFNIADRGLKVFDVYGLMKKTLTELKIGKDVHDYERLEDECNRAANNLIDHPNEIKELHLICCDESDYHISDQEWDIVVTLCCRHGVFPHRAKSIDHMMEKLLKIQKGEYTPKITMIKPTKSLSECAKRFAVIKGVAEYEAESMATKIDHDERKLYYIDSVGQIQVDRELIANLHSRGRNKNGSISKIAETIANRLEGIP